MFRLRLLLFGSFFLLLLGCTKNKDSEAGNSKIYKYRDYIFQVSSGTISAYEPVIIELQQPVEGWDTNQELDTDILTVSPRIKGKLIALSNKMLSFQPETKFQSNKKYHFTLKLHKLGITVAKELHKNFVFSVQTIKPQFTVDLRNLQSYSKGWQYMDGTITTNEVLPLETAQNLIKAEQNNDDLQIAFSKVNEKGKNFSFRIDSIQRFEDDATVELTWNGKKYDIETKGERSIVIPGKNNFVVTAVNVDNATNQLLDIHFSDPIKQNQNFDGLVQIGKAKNLKITVQGQTLKVYPQTELKGTLTLNIFEGIRSAENYKLKKAYTENIVFEQPKPEIRLLSSGIILPNSDNLKINFEAINLKAVDVAVYKIYQNNILQFLQTKKINDKGNLRRVARPVAKKRIALDGNTALNLKKWNAFAVDLKELIRPDMGAIYRVEFNYKRAYSLYQCEGSIAEEQIIEEEEENFDEAMETSYWDDGYGYDYDWNQRENPCEHSFYRNKKLKTNILASNLGVIVKKGNNNTFKIIVNDMLTTAPVENAVVRFYNYQQQEIASVTTNASGIANFNAKKTAFFAIASKGSQKTYIKLNDGNALSISKFDVAGVATKKGIKGYIYGERGVWRPGDSIYLSFMLNDNANKLPKGHPLVLELRDPYGKLVHQKTQTTQAANLYSFKLHTSTEAPTGNWQAKIKVGGTSFSKSLKIETIKPNRLKVKTLFDTEVLQTGVPAKGKLEAAWLHGATAKNLKADITARFKATKTKFPRFAAYTFDDPTRKFGSESIEVFNGILSSTGNANFKVTPNLDVKSAGMLSASFLTKVYENGGNFSTNVTTKTFSPYKTYVGLATPKGDKTRGMLLTDTKHKFDIVTVDQKGNPKAVENLEVQVFKVSWRWWWDTSEDNLSAYNRSTYNSEVFKTKVSTGGNGKAQVDFTLKYPEWGRYLVRVYDPKSKHATGKTIYIDWPGWAGKSRKADPSAATMLLFSTDKKKYNVGEMATVTFPSSVGGRALVSIENGSEVLSAFWVETKEGETKFELPVLKEYTPNVYIHISLLQPHASTKNDLPIRLYGITPIAVENSETHITPVISMPDTLEPESTVTVKVSEQNGQAMTYSIAVVDEGLLDLTNFSTPDPFKTFYAREALGVKTWDIYDDVIGAYGGNINQIFSIGGDAEAAAAGKSKKANRFKPVVVYKGPFQLKKGSSKNHKIKIPRYVGSVRTMVVAMNSGNEAYGKAEKATPVRKPLILLGTLPRKITPGERVRIPVSVFAMEPKIKNVSVSLSQNKGFKLIGNATQKLEFAQPDEKMVFFEIEVLDEAQLTEITLKASGNGERASFSIPMDIVNPNPITTQLTALVLEPKAKLNANILPFGIKDSNFATLEFSTLPPMNVEGRLQYLIRYPHGCVEQTTSSAFPQLFLNDILDLDQSRKQQVQLNVNAAITKLKNFMQPSGGFSYWPGYTNADDWGTSYAGHFLLEADKKGYMMPISFKTNWINYQQNVVHNWRGQDNFSQAYRLYTLALAEVSDLSAMNRLREKPKLSNDTKLRLAAAYALAGQKQAALDLYRNADLNFNTKKSYYGRYYGSVVRNKAMALETLILLDLKTEARQLAQEIAQKLSSSDWMSTQTTAYALLAMSKYATMVGGKGVNVQYAHNSQSSTVETTKAMAITKKFRLDAENNFTFTNAKDNTVFINIVSQGILPVGTEKVFQRNLRAVIDYKTKNGAIINPVNITQGTDFVAEISITNTSNSKIENVALSQILPSGWEIVNTRFTDFGSFKENKVTYTDIRDDRVNFYFDLDAKKTKTISTLLNASFLGKYYLPGVQCQAMYDNNYAVRTKGKWVNVNK